MCYWRDCLEELHCDITIHEDGITNVTQPKTKNVNLMFRYADALAARLAVLHTTLNETVRDQTSTAIFDASHSPKQRRYARVMLVFMQQLACIHTRYKHFLSALEQDNLFGAELGATDVLECLRHQVTILLDFLGPVTVPIDMLAMCASCEGLLLEAAIAASFTRTLICHGVTDISKPSLLHPIATTPHMLMVHLDDKKDAPSHDILGDARSVLDCDFLDATTVLVDYNIAPFTGPVAFELYQPGDTLCGPTRVAEVATGSIARNSTEVQDSPVHMYHLNQIRVSFRAMRLVKLLRRASNFARACSTSMKTLAFHALARDVVDLFAATSMRNTFDVHKALLLHNDALLLHHHCLTLSIDIINKQIPQSLDGGQACCSSFVDLAFDLDQLAAKTRRSLVAKAGMKMLDALIPDQGFQHIGEDDGVAESARSALSAYAFELKQLCTAACCTLALPILADLLGKAMDMPIAELNSCILNLHHISDADSRALREIVLEPVRVACARVFQQVDEVCRAYGDVQLQGACMRCAESYVPSLRKTQQLSWVLSVGLLQVHERWVADELDAIEARELYSLIHSLFDHAALTTSRDAIFFVSALADRFNPNEEDTLASRWPYDVEPM